MTDFYGDTGDNSFRITTADGNSTVDGRAGYDALTIDWHDVPDFYTIGSWDTGSLQGIYQAGSLTVAWRNIEKLTLTLGSGQDDFSVSGSADLVGTIDGGDGVDTYRRDFSYLTGALSLTFSDLPDAVNHVGSVELHHFEQIGLTAGAGDDVLTGGGQDDDLNGGGGNDTLHGGAGDDRLNAYNPAASGADRLYGDDGNDGLYASQHAVLDGGAGNDYLSLLYGSGSVLGGDGDDTLATGGDTASPFSFQLDQAGGVTASNGLTGSSIESVSLFSYGPMDVTLSAHVQSVTVRAQGTTGIDKVSVDWSGRTTAVQIHDSGNSIFGSAQHNTVQLALYGVEQTTLKLGAADDIATFYGGETLILDMGGGLDWLSYDFNRSNSGITFALDIAPDTQNVAGGGLSFRNVEAIDFSLTGYDDTVTGGAYDDRLVGLGGANTLSGLGGNDTLISGDGANSLDGGSGNDTISYRGSGATDVVAGGEGYDALMLALDGDGFAFAATGAGTYAFGPGAIVSGFEELDITLGGDSHVDIGREVMKATVAGYAGGTLSVSLDWSDRTTDATFNGYHGEDGSGGTVDLHADHRAVTFGSGDDAVSCYGGFDMDGGAGIDTFSVELWQTGAAIAFTLNDRPGALSTFVGEGSTLVDVERVTVVTGSGADTLTGGRRADSFYAQGGDDRLSGGGGNDTLDGDAGADRLLGGDGDDRLISGYDDGAGVDLLNGGSGEDRVDYSFTGSVRIDLAQGTARGQDIGRDRLVGIEDVLGSSARDTIAGDDGDNRLDGWYGSDRIDGRGGDDVLTGGYLNDVLTGGSGRDVFAFDDAAGRDEITDFTHGEHDRIRIASDTVHGFGDLRLRADGAGGTLVIWAGTRIDVLGIAPRSLVASDFAFTAAPEQAAPPRSTVPPLVAAPSAELPDPADRAFGIHASPTFDPHLHLV